ncbi:hypothetical protein GGR56DRAFT_41385 [Xylariaceae sp. FL0804]|nr:hypothetical protein GGR56DRAFT_41385 [Xylariaceae sp. FL0804]
MLARCLVKSFMLCKQRPTQSRPPSFEKLTQKREVTHVEKRNHAHRGEDEPNSKPWQSLVPAHAACQCSRHSAKMDLKVTLYERRTQVGGLWAYTDDTSMTSALKSTRALISKYTCSMTDFPMPDKYPSHLTSAQFQECIESCAKHFDLLKDVVFEASVKRAIRNEDYTRWRLEWLAGGEMRSHEFDKVVFCHGYQTRLQMPEVEGADLDEGQLMHAQ